MSKCEGRCKRCCGNIKRVRVTDAGRLGDLGLWSYCLVAIDACKRQGFKVIRLSSTVNAQLP